MFIGVEEQGPWHVGILKERNRSADHSRSKGAVPSGIGRYILFRSRDERVPSGWRVGDPSLSLQFLVGEVDGNQRVYLQRHPSSAFFIFCIVLQINSFLLFCLAFAQSIPLHRREQHSFCTSSSSQDVCRSFPSHCPAGSGIDLSCESDAGVSSFLFFRGLSEPVQLGCPQPKCIRPAAKWGADDGSMLQ